MLIFKSKTAKTGSTLDVSCGLSFGLQVTAIPATGAKNAVSFKLECSNDGIKWNDLATGEIVGAINETNTDGSNWLSKWELFRFTVVRNSGNSEVIANLVYGEG